MRGDEADVRQGPCVLARDEVQERRLEERAVLAAQAAVAWTAEKSGCQRDARPGPGSRMFVFIRDGDLGNAPFCK